MGLQKGDIVGIVLPNCIEFPVLVLGCLYLGITVTPINPGSTTHEISRQLSASTATCIFGHSSSIGKLQQTLDLTPAISKAVVVGDKLEGNKNFLHWNDFIKSSNLSPIPDPAIVDIKKDIAILPFSSGTTGAPKGVMLSQYNLVAGIHPVLCNDPEFILTAAGLNQEVEQ